MNLMNKLILSVAAIVLCTASAEAQSRRNYRPSNTYSYNPVPSSTVRVTPQQQTVYKPVVAPTSPATTVVHATPVSYTVSAPAAVNAVGGVEGDIVAQTNAQRARYGLPPLSICPNLMSSARQHCSWMASANSMTHTRAAVAENIAAGQHSASDALNSWMNSSGHRANILGRGYTTIGVAAVTSANGQTYWCQQFR